MEVPVLLDTLAAVSEPKGYFFSIVTKFLIKGSL